MDEVLEQYGGIITAVIVATGLLLIVNSLNTSFGTVLDQKVLNNDVAQYEADYVNPGDTANYKNGGGRVSPPQLEVFPSYEINTGDYNSLEDVARDCVYTAFNSTSFNVATITGDTAKSGGKTKKALVKGYVNVVCSEDIDFKSSGEFNLEIYAKSAGPDGLWTKKQCKLIITAHKTKIND